MKFLQLNKIFLLLTLLSLLGCGFHLKGAIVIPEDLKVVKITPNNPSEKFQNIFRKTLKKKGVKIVEDPVTNVTTLHLSEPVFVEEVQALGQNNQPQRLKLTMSFSYSLYDKNGNTIQKSETIKSASEFTIDPNNLLSANSEREIIKNELYIDGISKLMQRISREVRRYKD